MIAAVIPEIPLFALSDSRGAAPSPLAYSLREECFPGLNARLRAEEFGHSSNHQFHQSNRIHLCSLEQCYVRAYTQRLSEKKCRDFRSVLQTAIPVRNGEQPGNTTKD